MGSKNKGARKHKIKSQQALEPVTQNAPQQLDLEKIQLPCDDNTEKKDNTDLNCEASSKPDILVEQSQDIDSEKQEQDTKKINANSLIQIYSNYLYPIFYILSVQIIRKSKKIKRYFLKNRKKCYWFCKRYAMDFYDFVGDNFIKMRNTVCEPFVEFFGGINSVMEAASDEELNGVPFFKSVWKFRSEVFHSISSFKKPIKKMMNYVLPVLSVFVFLFTITYISNMTFALSVDYNGTHIGYIDSETIFNEAEKEVKSRMTYEEKYKQPENKVPVFKLSVIEKNEVTNTDTISNEIIKASGNEINSADGLYIDGDFVGATNDGTNLLMLLDDIKNEYKTDNPKQTVEFSNKIEVKEGLYPNSAISDLSNIKDKLDGTVEQAVVYTIKAGDTPSEVAQRYGIATSELISKNAEVSKTFRPEEKLTIKGAVDRLTVQVSEEITYEEAIDFGTDKVESNSYYEGYQKVIQAGKQGTERITAKVVSVNGIEQSRTILDREVISKPVNQKIVVGTKVPLYNNGGTTAGSSKNFAWPVAGGRMSCGWWGYYGHTGMDISARTGTPVLASASGTVSYAGWKNGGYGNLVIINHGGGVTTLYLHNSAIYVKSGQVVTQGQQIAAMGQTGNAYGSHCHFEIRLSGTPVNPAKYIGSRSPY
ncbi:MAG: peptidoglycan DD-metalloendopeptidase family protein [Oscillospiraceae bacterium]